MGATLLPLVLLLAEQVVIRSDTRLVEISVVATDKKGRPVTDLAREDFEVFDNREPQTIAVFSAESRKAAPAPPRPAGEFSNRLQEAEGHSVVLLDWLNTAWSDQTRGRQKVIEMLGRIETRDRVALYVLDRRLRILHEFGGDPASLVRKLEGLRGDGAALLEEDRDAFGISIADTMSPQERIFLMDRRILNTLGALEAIAGRLSGVPGKKSLIWVSAGFPMSIDNRTVRGARVAERTYSEEFRSLVRRLNNAGVSVYPIDARGLTPAPGAFINIATMLELASRTGGRAWYNRNDLDAGMRLALDDLHTTYTLAYYAAGDGSRPGFHRLRVRVRRPGITLRHREGYWVEKPAAAAAVDIKSELQRALLAPVDTSGVAVSAQATCSGGILTLGLRVERANAGKLHVLMRFAAQDGRQVGSIASELVEPGQNGDIRRSTRMPPRAASLRVVVRDQDSGAIGTLSIPLHAVPGN